ncbi:MAG: baseplate wedge protein, partial [Euryarchaeota archaeon]|nr:baseplate wedge protein [Euryarchaeota archaeon]
WLPISNKTNDTFEVNVGVSPDTTTHVFQKAATKGIRRQSGVVTVNVGKSPTKGYDVTDASFVPGTGLLTVTIGNHSLTANTAVRIANNSLVFKCNQDSYGSDHTYPRANGQGGASGNDPAWNTAVNITAVTPTTVTLDVGTSSNTTTHVFQNANNTYSPTLAVYNPTTGVITLTIADHGFVAGEHVQIADGGLKFTCAHDDYATTHSYPRVTDPVSNQWIPISNVQTNTFDIQVLDVAPSSNITAHTFVSAVANCVRRAVISTGGNYTHTFVGNQGSNTVSYTPQASHTFVSCDPGAVKHQLTTHNFSQTTPNGVKVLDYSTSDCTDVQTTIENLISIVTDTLDSAIQTPPVDYLGSITKYTPPHEFLGGRIYSYYEEEFPINWHDGTEDIMFTNQVGTSGKYRFQDAANLVQLNAGPIVDKASYDMLQRYPDLALDMPRNFDGSGSGTLQCKTDLALILQEFIKDLEDGGNFNTVNVAKRYLGANDILLHIRLQVFQSAYAHERLAYYMKQAINGDLTTGNTDKIIVGAWGITQSTAASFTPTAATYEPTTGDLTLTIGSHTLVKGRMITIALNGLTFRCLEDSNGSDHTYPRITDPAYQQNLKITEYTATTITVNVGISSNTTLHTFQSAITDCVTAPADCTNVKDAIDNLVTIANDIIAPTHSDYAIAADRLYFNRGYIAEEITSLVTAEFTYMLDTSQQFAFTYPEPGGTTTCQRDLKLIILAIISDLQTGGNNSTVAAMEYYLSSLVQIINVEDELLATLYAIEQLGFLCEHAAKGELRDRNSGAAAPLYAAQYTNTEAYTDLETPTDMTHVGTRIKELVNTAINIIGPGKRPMRGASKNLIYNRGYYKEEIQNLVNAQFGSGTWVYNDFIDSILTNLSHDLITTDISDSSIAHNVTIEDVIGNFEVGELITSSLGSAKVLEWNADNDFLVIGEFVGKPWISNTIITGTRSSTQAIVSVNGVGSSYTWFNSPGNVRTLNYAKNITSNISGQISGLNLFSNPELFTPNWVGTGVGISDNFTIAPDNNNTAAKLISSADSGEHTLHRIYDLSAYDTFDDGNINWDDTTNSFDEGGASTSDEQQYTFSCFFKKAEYEQVRFHIVLDDGTAGEQNIFFDLNTNSGTTGSLFIPQGGITGDAYGAVPYGGGWYRAYITTTLSFGFTELKALVTVYNENNQIAYTGDSSKGLYAWGSKLSKGTLDPYTSSSNEVFYADGEFNIKTYALTQLEDYIIKAMTDGLISPSPQAGYLKFFDIESASHYDIRSVSRIVRDNIKLLKEQLAVDTYYTGVTVYNGIKIPTYTYGNRELPVGLGGGLNASDYLYGLSSDSYAELETIAPNQGEIVKIYQRFRFDGDVVDGPWVMNETVAKNGDPSVTGKIYGLHEDENFKYLDIEVTGGTWAITDYVVGSTNNTTAQISLIEDRLQVIDLTGEFDATVPFKGYTSGATATPTSFLRNEAAILDNTGGTLTVDTETLVGSFEQTSVVYPETSRQFIEVSKFDGLDIGVGDRIASNGYVRIGVSIVSGLNQFNVGNRLYKVLGGVADQSTYAIITEVDIDNNFLYIADFQGTPLANGDLVGDYGLGGNFPEGYASIITRVETPGAGAALVQDIRPAGQYKRLYLSDMTGTFDLKDSVIGPGAYKAAVQSKVDLKARVKRAFKGFDGVQDTFDLSILNGTNYLPDPDGHMLIYVNGILQPPGASNAYTAFSNQIQFTEAPELGASFTGFYVGKLRQLDDISFEFDSLRQSFNLKRNDVFYSLTLTEGVQSSTIRPENNIICSLNGVVQEPGVGFEIVGSRIIFSEIPRVGSTFVAFSYVGSEADVDAAEVVPPIEPGDFIDIQGETSDREVAVIESSNSLITFDYLGSVFGQDAQATANINSGFIDTVQVTSGGSSYTSRPNVRIDSISGFDGNIRALVGVAGVEMSTPGSGYQNPEIVVETTVPDDWNAPDLSQYGEEEVDPETP